MLLECAVADLSAGMRCGSGMTISHLLLSGSSSESEEHPY